MKKNELETGMIIQTAHNRYGFVERDRNRIVICYDPDVILDEYRHLENVSLDNVFEYDNGKLGVGFIVTKDDIRKFPDVYGNNKPGDLLINYEIVAVYTSNRIYYNGIGSYPPLIIDD